MEWGVFCFSKSVNKLIDFLLKLIFSTWLILAKAFLLGVAFSFRVKYHNYLVKYMNLVGENGDL